MARDVSEGRQGAEDRSQEDGCEGSVRASIGRFLVERFVGEGHDAQEYWDHSARTLQEAHVSRHRAAGASFLEHPFAELRSTLCRIVATLFLSLSLSIFSPLASRVDADGPPGLVGHKPRGVRCSAGSENDSAISSNGLVVAASFLVSLVDSLSRIRIGRNYFDPRVR